MVSGASRRGRVGAPDGRQGCRTEAASNRHRLVLAVPFVLVWLVPVVYRIYEGENHSWADDLLHAASYLSMGWLNFVLLLSLARDALLWLSLDAAPRLHAGLDGPGTGIVFGGAAAAP